MLLDEALKVNVSGNEVKPKPASTVLLIRDSQDAVEVFMIKREIKKYTEEGYFYYFKKAGLCK